MSAYETVIGLEVHVHLCTKSKLFCSCPTTFGVEPNTNVCEVCAGMPGVLPVLNQTAVEYATRAGLALNCAINNDSVFARKNYFYPDMPYNYQISQFERPLCEHGHLDIEVGGETKRIGITRIHMETDAGKNIHEGDHSYLDLNRAAVPLIEIVSEPDMRSAEEAVAYLKALHAIVVYLGITDGNMEEGSFRCDANVSIRPKGTVEFGTRTELKNLNSFRHVQKAIEFEVARQQDVLEDGDKVIQETRLFDSVKGVTMSMRDKEEAHDYRYFPDPDLVPVHISEEQLESWKASLPELPAARRRRFMDEWKLPEQDAEIITADRAQADFFEAAVALYSEPRKIANYMTGPMLREINQTGVALKDSALKPEALAELAKIVDGGLISAKIAQDIFSDLYAEGVMPEAYVREKGLVQVSDTSAIDAAVAEVLAENLEAIKASDIHTRLGLEKGKYILLSAHREENIDTEKNFQSLFTAINRMAEKYDLPVLYSCHPRSRKRLENSSFMLDGRVIQHEPLGFHDYNCLQMNAFCVVSDSGTLPEESSFFTSVGHPFPAVCIRTSTERPEALDKACFILSGIDTKGLLQAVDTAVQMIREEKNGGAVPVPDYIDTNVSGKVIKIIQSYVGVVNRMVWRKQV